MGCLGVCFPEIYSWPWRSQDFCILLHIYYTLVKCLLKKIEYRIKKLTVPNDSLGADIPRGTQGANNP